MSCLVCGRPESVAPFVSRHQYGGGVCHSCKNAPSEALAALERLEVIRHGYGKYVMSEQEYQGIHRHIQAAAQSLRLRDVARLTEEER